MQLVLSLADEGETMQSLCSDLCIGCQSELGLSTRFPPCAIAAEIHLLLLTYLVFSLSTFPLTEFCRRWFHDCSTYQIYNYGKCSFSYIGPVTWNSLPKPLRDTPSLPSFKSNLKTFLFKKHLCDWRLSQGCWAKLSFLYICMSCVARMIVLTCCFLFTVLLRYLKNFQINFLSWMLLVNGVAFSFYCFSWWS